MTVTTAQETAERELGSTLWQHCVNHPSRARMFARNCLLFDDPEFAGYYQSARELGESGYRYPTQAL